MVVIATQDPANENSRVRYEKTLANIKEVQARQGRVVALASQHDRLLPTLVEDLIEVPAAPELLLPIIEIVPLQLLAYHIGVLRGCDGRPAPQLGQERDGRVSPLGSICLFDMAQASAHTV